MPLDDNLQFVGRTLVQELRVFEFRGSYARGRLRSATAEASANHDVWCGLVLAIANIGKTYINTVHKYTGRTPDVSDEQLILLRFELSKPEFQKAQEFARTLRWVKTPDPEFFHRVSRIDDTGPAGDFYALNRGRPLADVLLSLFFAQGLGIQLVLEESFSALLEHLSSPELVKCLSCNFPRVKGNMCPFCGNGG